MLKILCLFAFILMTILIFKFYLLITFKTKAHTINIIFAHIGGVTSDKQNALSLITTFCIV